MEFRVDDRQLDAAAFLAFVDQIWPGRYDADKTAAALSRTMNITAYDGETLVGCLRILSDGYYFGTITELLVLPDYRRQGVGSRLLRLARENSPTVLYFGAQPDAEAFYEKNGCEKGLQAYTIPRKRE
jgi:GNAT superfamily N-acetyltransferase